MASAYERWVLAPLPRSLRRLPSAVLDYSLRELYRWLTKPFLVLVFVLTASHVLAGPPDGNRLTYLDRADPYYVGLHFPKLVTPQWVGEEGVEAVVILAIDDMRGPDKWEAYLRPILERLKKIDGRAPVSIMTNQIDPKPPPPADVAQGRRQPGDAHLRPSLPALSRATSPRPRRPTTAAWICSPRCRTTGRSRSACPAATR